MTDLQLIAAPVPPGGIDTVRRDILALQGSLGSVVVWWPSTGVAFSGVAYGGDLLCWSLFTAADEKSARDTAREQFELAMRRAMEATERAAAAQFPGLKPAAH
jgi:hypothetical protein